MFYKVSYDCTMLYNDVQGCLRMYKYQQNFTRKLYEIVQPFMRLYTVVCTTFCVVVHPSIRLYYLVQGCTTLYEVVLPCLRLYYLVRGCSTLYDLVHVCTAMYMVVEPCTWLYNLVHG